MPTRHLAAVVDPKQAGVLLRAMGDHVAHPIARVVLALSALLFMRQGKLRRMEWDGSIWAPPR